MAFLYWITDNTSADIRTYGYVGITSRTVKSRINQHIRSYKRYLDGHNTNGCIKLIRAINKLGGWENIKVVPICESTITYCLEMEHILRPSPNIGWNIRVGGNTPVMAGRVVSESTKDKLSIVRSKWKMSERSRLKLSSERTGHLNPMHGTQPWFNPSNTDDSLNTWLFADDIFNKWKFKPCGTKRLTKSFTELNYWTIDTMIRKFKTGWVPSQDNSWLIFKDKNAK